MAAAYDSYDYPAYWEGREYEHESEIIAFKKFLRKIKSIKRVGDFGSGYGRLLPYYSFRAKQIVLVDSSASSLKQARSKFSNYNNIKYMHSKIENIRGKLKKNTFDLIIMVRVLHHVKDIKNAISEAKRLLKPGGYLILEFPNKLHGKSIFKNMIRGNFTYPLDIFPLDKSRDDASLPFYNYHPEVVVNQLEKNYFSIQEKYSVSNLRNKFFKNNIPIGLLLLAEEYSQKILSYFNFGPSIFILAKLNK